eukprot:1463378-Rhodomonas_salina.3
MLIWVTETRNKVQESMSGIYRPDEIVDALLRKLAPVKDPVDGQREYTSLGNYICEPLFSDPNELSSISSDLFHPLQRSA